MTLDTRKQIMIGYTKTQEAINVGRLKDWTSLDTENENKGALAAVTFYGACVRECMSQGIDNSYHVHMLAGILISLIEDDGIEDVLLFMIGRPLSPKLTKIINLAIVKYKEDYQSVIDEFLSMVNNIKINFGFDDETDTDYNIEDDDDDGNIRYVS
jgi:hypothetical protein